MSLKTLVGSGSGIQKKKFGSGSGSGSATLDLPFTNPLAYIIYVTRQLCILYMGKELGSHKFSFFIVVQYFPLLKYTQR